MRDLPYDVLRHISTFLEYNDRVSLNVCLPASEQFVKTLNSDSHNLAVKVNLIRQKLNHVENVTPNTKEKIRALKRLFLYLLHTKDMCLFTKTNRNLYNAFLTPARLHSREDVYDPFMFQRHRKEVRSLIRVSQQLVSYLESMTPNAGESLKMDFVKVT